MDLSILELISTNLPKKITHMNEENLRKALAISLLQDDYEALESLAKTAVATYPDKSFGYYYLGEVLHRSYPPKYEEAEVCLAKALEIEPENLGYWTRFAELKEAQARLEDAQLIWGKILGKDPNHVAALVAKAAFQLRQFQDYPQALELLDRAVLLAPNDASIYLYRAEALSGTDDFEEALAAVERSLELLDGFNEAATALKVTILEQLQATEQLATPYESLTTNSDTPAAYHASYGQYLFQNEQYAAASEQLAAAIEHTPEPDAIQYRILGEAALYALLLEQATEALQQSLALEPDSTETLLLLLDAKIEQEAYQDAIQLIDQHLPKLSEDRSYTEQLLIKKSRALTALEELSAAEAILLPLAKAKGIRQKEAFYGLGTIYQQQNTIPKAYQFMKAAAAAKHPLAADYIQAYFQNFLEQAEQKAMEVNAPAFKSNLQNPFIKPILGHWWRFEALESARLAEAPAELVQKMEAGMQPFSLLFTPKGFLLLAPEGPQRLTYRIKDQANDQVSIECLPLDNSSSFVWELKRSGRRLSVSSASGEWMHLQATNRGDLEDAWIQWAKDQTAHLSLNYLGSAKALDVLQ